MSILMISAGASAQLSDLARVEYTVLPATNSDFEFNRVRALFNYPLKLKTEGSYLFLGVDYSNINIVYEDEIPFDRDELNGFQLFDLNIGYTQLLKNGWRLGARFTPGISSNLQANDITVNDIVLSADVVFIKDRKDDVSLEKPYRLIVGVSYSGNRGFPYPLPFISYYRRLNDKWSYNLGVPKTNVQYHFNDKHRLKFSAELDGFTANIQNGATVNDDIAESINMSLILSGFQYEFHLAKRLELYSKLYYVVDRNVQLRDGNRDNFYQIDDSQTLSFKIGVRVKI